MPTIILCQPMHANGMALLEARHDVTIRTLNRPSPKELAEAMPGAHAALIGSEVVDEPLLAASPDLRIVSRFGVGYDTVDVAACTRRGVVVSITAGGNDLSVAEHTLMLLLAVARRTVEMDAAARAGRWMLRDGRPMGELAGRLILVVGYGRIGSRVARLCAAFGMNVMVLDPAFAVPRIAADGFTPVTDIAAVLSEIDVLTLHCPLGEGTRHMINREMLSLMKPTAWLINTARGPLVDEAALIEALSSGRLEAAGLDVLLHEPPDPANPLLKLPNVVLSPHNAAAPLECNETMSIRAAKNMLEFLDGVLDPGYAVNAETLPHRRNA
jgi:D-3-phosphoglycerate dehydrogenase / 2-oxoglutarate reductase